MECFNRWKMLHWICMYIIYSVFHLIVSLVTIKTDYIEFSWEFLTRNSKPIGTWIIYKYETKWEYSFLLIQNVWL